MAGDMNMTPQQFNLGAKQWLDKLQGTVKSPGVRTCTAGAVGRELDYFIVDDRIVGGVRGVKVYPSDVCTCSPHFIVALQIHVTASREMIDAPVRPKKLPAIIARGCQKGSQPMTTTI